MKKTIALASALILVTMVAAAAGQTITLKGRVMSYTVRQLWLPVGGAPGHQLGLVRQTGTAEFQGGTKARFQSVMTHDLRAGRKSSYQGYVRLDFGAGSRIFIRVRGSSLIEGRRVVRTQGQGVILRGAGRYQGIKGRAVFTGRGLPATMDSTPKMDIRFRLKFRL